MSVLFFRFESGSYFPGPDVPEKFRAGGMPRANTAPEPEPIKPVYG